MVVETIRRMKINRLSFSYEETPQGGLSCPCGAIHLQLAAQPTDEVDKENTSAVLQ